MSCSCTNTQLVLYTVEYDSGTGGFTIKDAGGTAVSSCGGQFTVTVPTSYDCVRLKFSYVPPVGGPADLLPISTSGTCPCEVSNGTEGSTKVHYAKFQVPASGDCSYLWVLSSTQPTCRIRIVITA